MKKLTCALVGAGNRGTIYCDYSFDAPDELEIVAVVDIDKVHLNIAKERYHLSDERAFDHVDDFLQAGIKCDFVIDATMDEAHYETAKKIIDAGYTLLLEKPITPKKKELLDLQRRAKANNVEVFICHVLRYTPFYTAVKKLVDTGAVGEIMTMELDEHVGIGHFIDSYVRGKWNSEARCGSGFLLAKSCHDADLMCWLNNKTEPEKVTSVGTRAQFIPENAPKGATAYCYNCPHNDTCLYSAQKIHLEVDEFWFQTWIGMGKPVTEITKEEKAEYLKHDTYGKCAYNAGGDIVDRQSLAVQFANGSVASFTMVGGTPKAERKLHICGTHGEIEGVLEENRFVYRRFDRSEGKFEYVDTVIDVSEDVYESKNYSGHAGGDYALMHALVRYLNGDRSSAFITSLDDSVNSHLLVYAAEKSRKTGKTQKIK